MDRLAILVEEATRSTHEGIKRFVEPAQGTLNRATSKRMHLIFGRRGSGKSSLLLKAQSELSLQRRPVAYVDLETFKGHSYPDVLLSILIKTMEEFKNWLDTAAINPNNKISFWQKCFGRKPQNPPLNKKLSKELSIRLTGTIDDLKKQLYSPDEAECEERKSALTSHEIELSAKSGAKTTLVEIGAGVGDRSKMEKTAGITDKFKRKKVDFLLRHILEFKDLFGKIADLSYGEAFLLLDDLYHIPKKDQPDVIDYFHRIAKDSKLWLKIGSVRHRTVWYLHGDPPKGIKLGDDADNIDLYITLEKYKLAKEFLKKILSEL